MNNIRLPLFIPTMKKELTLIEISDEKPIRKWAQQLMTTRYHEALDSLDFEGVVQESVFLITLNDKKYLAFYMQGDVMGPSDKTKQINKDHVAILKSIRIVRTDAELLYDLEKRK